MKFLDPNQSYTFSKIFDMKISARDLSKEFDYSFSRKRLNLPQYQEDLERIKELQERLDEILPYFDLSNETSRREVLVSPVILELVHYTKSQVRIEYQIKVNEQLQGYLDYFLENHKNLLVIEAKKEDLDYGFSQLIAQLIALEQWQENKNETNLVGAITTGNIWQFGRLNRKEKSIEQDLNLYRVPDDLDTLMRILVQALI